MNNEIEIPSAVMNAAWKASARGGGDKAMVQVIARWARVEALKDAEAEIRAIPCWADGAGSSGFDVGPDPVRVVRDTLSALRREISDE